MMVTRVKTQLELTDEPAITSDVMAGRFRYIHIYHSVILHYKTSNYFIKSIRRLKTHKNKNPTGKG